MSKHTPGPWIVTRRTQKEGDCNPGIWIHGKDHQTVFDSGALDVFPLSEANATLIAAAPDLLQSLEYVLAMIAEDDLIPEDVSYMRLARAAIAKAKGTS